MPWTWILYQSTEEQEGALLRENKDLGTLVLLHAPRCRAVLVAFIPPCVGAMDGDKDDFLPAAGDPQWITTSEWDGRRLSRGQRHDSVKNSKWRIPDSKRHEQCVGMISGSVNGPSLKGLNSHTMALIEGTSNGRKRPGPKTDPHYKMKEITLRCD
ncbi:unnamed protein product [Miscanthus lutarioriparius]|uniref:Uncharacterized protein n=1 Tax=Miscanthus lutarioriparius TaxID=422564 RepID=A0A811RH59_9POAL|nr:unnamed protein product [Miscanthus lutarioriparius]